MKPMKVTIQRPLTLLGWLFVAGSMAFTMSCTRPDARGTPLKDLQASHATEASRPGAVVEVSSSLKGAITPDSPVEIELWLEPIGECDELKSAVRGLDGVTVAGGEELSHGKCVPGSSFSRKVSVRIPRGQAGSLVVDVDAAVEGGRLAAASQSFEVRARGAQADAGLKKMRGAKVAKDRDGNPLIILKPQARPEK